MHYCNLLNRNLSNIFKCCICECSGQKKKKIERKLQSVFFSNQINKSKIPYSKAILRG